MSDNKKISEILDKMDEKMLKAKINTALDMIKNNKDAELKKIMDKADKKDIEQKLNEIDKDTLKSMKIDVNEVKKRISDEDFNRVAQIIGSDGDRIIERLKELLK